MPSTALSAMLQSGNRRHVLAIGIPVVVGLVSAYALQRARAPKPAATGASNDGKNSNTSKPPKGKQVGVNAEFLRQLKKLLPICIPGITSQEAGWLATLAVVLLARTWLDIWFSAFNGEVVRAIVTRDKTAFINKVVITFGLMMWPMSVVNNMLKLCISALAIRFRTRLTKHAHDLYLDGLTFYKVSNLDNRLQNPDQLVTQDIDRFAENLSHLYSDIAKPIVDIILFASRLGEALGFAAPVLLMLYFVTSGAILKALSPSFGKLTAESQRLEGDFRFIHSRVITHSEEIAFYDGAKRELGLVENGFDRISKHLKKIFRLKFMNGIFDSILVKYMATMTAYWLLSRPVFDPAYATEKMGGAGMAGDSTKIMEDYSRNSGYLVKLSQAIGALMMEARNLAQFAGYTSRVHDLFEVLDDVRKGKFERTMMTGKGGTRDGKGVGILSDKEPEPAQKDSSATSAMLAAAPASESKKTVIDSSKLPGNVVYRDHTIEFQKVPIITPNGDVLVKEMTFKVVSGMNCLISGPNGCGKSGLARILSNLWPLFGGTLTKPSMQNMFYVPQKPYLPLGTLRDQIIYPHTVAQMKQRGQEEKDLEKLMAVVQLDYLVTREGGWDSHRDWSEVLSGGEKQRVAMARLFYHRPQFALLDECTSAVSVDVEAIMYNYAKDLGITLFTIAHRQSLWKYHEYLLRYDGEGGYIFTRLLPGQNPFQFGHGKGAAAAATSASQESSDPQESLAHAAGVSGDDAEPDAADTASPQNVADAVSAEASVAAGSTTTGGELDVITDLHERKMEIEEHLERVLNELEDMEDHDEIDVNVDEDDDDMDDMDRD